MLWTWETVTSIPDGNCLTDHVRKQLFSNAWLVVSFIFELHLFFPLVILPTPRDEVVPRASIFSFLTE